MSAETIKTGVLISHPAGTVGARTLTAYSRRGDVLAQATCAPVPSVYEAIGAAMWAALRQLGEAPDDEAAEPERPQFVVSEGGNQPTKKKRRAPRLDLVRGGAA